MSGTEKVTTYLAAGAVVSPAWLPILRDVSNVAGLLLPILGVIWLVVQISSKIREHFRPPDKN